MSKKIEIVANVATILVGLLLSVVLVKEFLLPQPRRAPNRAATSPARGANLTKSLPGVDWQKNGRTVILAISTECHFCTESAPFYRRIGDGARNDLKVMAVLPQPQAQAEQYLASEGVRVDDIRQAALGSLGVKGTPTLLLVNSSAVVTDAWVGILGPDEQERVMAVLREK